MRKKQGTLFGTLTSSGEVINKSVINLNKVKSNDPIAFAYGLHQGQTGQPFPKEKGLASEYIRGFKLGRRKK